MTQLDDEDKKSPEQVRREQELNDIRSLMGTPYGRRFIERLVFEMTGTLHTSFTGNSNTFFNEGRRSVGLHVLDEVSEAGETIVLTSKALGGNHG